MSLLYLPPSKTPWPAVKLFQQLFSSFCLRRNVRRQKMQNGPWTSQSPTHPSIKHVCVEEKKKIFELTCAHHFQLLMSTKLSIHRCCIQTLPLPTFSNPHMAHKDNSYLWQQTICKHLYVPFFSSPPNSLIICKESREFPKFLYPSFHQLKKWNWIDSFWWNLRAIIHLENQN